eukprot:813315-Rhodomonas_salina.1
MDSPNSIKEFSAKLFAYAKGNEYFVGGQSALLVEEGKWRRVVQGEFWKQRQLLHTVMDMNFPKPIQLGAVP